MKSTLGHYSQSELFELAYVYAIGAVDGREQRSIEHAIANADRFTRRAFDNTVREVREIMALVSATQAVAPPEALRERVLSATTPKHRHVRLRRTVLSGAAVLALLAGSGLVNLVSGPPPSDTIATQVQAAADRHDLTVPLTGGGTMTVVYSAKLAHAFVTLDGVAAAPTGRTYQLWLLKSGAHPAGLPVPGSPTTVVGFIPGSSLAVTIEDAGGAPQPTMTPLAVATLSA